MTFDAEGAVWATAENADPDSLDVVGVARENTVLGRVHPLSGYLGMTAIDAVDHVVTLSSGHAMLYADRRSEADVVDTSSSSPTGSSSYVDLALVIRGDHQFSFVSDPPSFCLPFDWTCIPDLSFGPFGVRAVDIAVDAAGRRAMVGEYWGLGGSPSGVIKVLPP